MVIMLCDRTDRMRRRHVRIDGVKHIGKETDEIEETKVLGLDKDSYVEYRPNIERDHWGRGGGGSGNFGRW